MELKIFNWNHSQTIWIAIIEITMFSSLFSYSKEQNGFVAISLLLCLYLCRLSVTHVPLTVTELVKKRLICKYELGENEKGNRSLWHGKTNDVSENFYWEVNLNSFDWGNQHDYLLIFFHGRNMCQENQLLILVSWLAGICCSVNIFWNQFELWKFNYILGILSYGHWNLD